MQTAASPPFQSAFLRSRLWVEASVHSHFSFCASFPVFLPIVAVFLLLFKKSSLFWCFHCGVFWGVCYVGLKPLSSHGLPVSFFQVHSYTFIAYFITKCSYLFIHLYVWAQCMYVEVREQSVGFSFLLLSCVSQGSNSGQQDGHKCLYSLSYLTGSL